MDDPSLRVLLIEDEPADATFITLLLSESSKIRFQVEPAVRLAEGLEKLAEGGIDVVLLDLNLPDARGFETLTAVHSASPAVPVVVLTGLGDEDTGFEAVRQGAQDFLIKGEIDTNLLVRSLRYAIERNQSRQQVRESESRLRLVTEQVAALLWTTDCELRFTSSLGREATALNLQQERVLGKSVYEYFETDKADLPLIAMHLKAVYGQETSGDVEWGQRLYHAHVEPLRDADGQIVGTVGVALNVTDQRHMEQGLEAARRIQQHLLPKKAPHRPGFDIAGACFPAQRCSGDYFDYIPMRDQRLGIVLADVAGHGVGPAILAATVRSYLRATAMQDKDVHEMLTTTNWLLALDTEGSQYVTLICCQIDPRTSSLVYAAAGHQGFLMRSSGRVKVLDSTCMPLGMEEHEIVPLSRRIALFPGDVLLFMTDGVAEAESIAKKTFGVQGALDVVQARRHEPASEIVTALYQAVCNFTHPGPQQDDITAVVVKIEADGNVRKKDNEDTDDGRR
jgi:DNA-binding response OmpR family regulator